MKTLALALFLALIAFRTFAADAPGSRAAIAATFKTADRVEIYLLNHGFDKNPEYQIKKGDESFPITPYKQWTKVLKKLPVTPEDTGKWTAALAKLLMSKKADAQALCHYPIHGVRIYAGKKLLFETSICWHCNNYYVGANWQPLSSDADDLKKLLNDALPIPQKESDRIPSTEKKDASK